MIETEEEFGRDLTRIVEDYIKTVENAKAPKVVTDNKDLIFGNFKQITEFHNTWVCLLSNELRLQLLLLCDITFITEVYHKELIIYKLKTRFSELL